MWPVVDSAPKQMQPMHYYFACFPLYLSASRGSDSKAQAIEKFKGSSQIDGMPDAGYKEPPPV